MSEKSIQPYLLPFGRNRICWKSWLNLILLAVAGFLVFCAVFFVVRSRHVDGYGCTYAVATQTQRLKSVLPHGASDINYRVYTSTGDVLANFQITEACFLSWAQSKGWGVANVAKVRWPNTMNLWSVIDDETDRVEIEEGYYWDNGDLAENRRKGIRHVLAVGYDKCAQRAYYFRGRD